MKCFGDKLHLIVDATYEMPVAFKLSKASASDYGKNTSCWLVDFVLKSS